MRINAKCSVLMAAYFAVHCIVLSYVTLYLGSIGCSDLFISIVVASGCALGGVFQIVGGRILDTSKKWNWKMILILFGLLELVLSVSRQIVQARTWQWIAYGLIIVVQLMLMPMVYLSCFDYSAKGMKVNFGFVRGIGSAAFTVFSFVIGKLASVMGSGCIPWLTSVLIALFLLSVLIMPDPGMPLISGQNKTSKVKISVFIRQYPAFTVMVAGLGLLMGFHNMISSFFIRVVEYLKGGSGSLGIALGIGAFAEIPVLLLYSRIKGNKENNSVKFIIVSCLFFVARSVLYLLSGNIVMICMVQLLQGVSFGLMVAARSTYADECMGTDDKATGQSMMTFTDAFGAVAGTLTGGILLNQGGVSYMLAGGIVIALLGSAIAMFAAKGSGFRRKYPT